jgi:hypothetical protein
LTVRKAELQDSLTLELTDSVIDDLMRFRETVAVGLQNPTFEDKRRWLEILRVNVTVKNGKFTISWRLHNSEPPHERTLQTEVQTYRSSFLSQQGIDIILTPEPIDLATLLFSKAGKVEYIV